MLTMRTAKNFVPHIWTIETSDGEFDVIRAKCDAYGACKFMLDNSDSNLYFICDYTEIMLSNSINNGFIGYIKPGAGMFFED